MLRNFTSLSSVRVMRQDIVITCRCNGSHFVQCRPYLHSSFPFLRQTKNSPGSSAEGVKKKNAPDRRKPLPSRTNKAWPFIRGATLTSWERPHALGGMPTHPRQLTYALRCRILCGRHTAVPCTLSGPFREKAAKRRIFLDERFPACFSAAQALCTGIVRRYLRFNGLVY